MTFGKLFKFFIIFYFCNLLFQLHVLLLVFKFVVI